MRERQVHNSLSSDFSSPDTFDEFEKLVKVDISFTDKMGLDDLQLFLCVLGFSPPVPIIALRIQQRTTDTIERYFCQIPVTTSR